MSGKCNMKLTRLMGDYRKPADLMRWSRWPKLMAPLLILMLGVTSSPAPIYTDYTDASAFAAALAPGGYLNDFSTAGSGASLSFTGPTPVTGPFSYTVTSSGAFGVTGVDMAALSGLGRSISTFDENAVLIFTFTGATKPTAIGGNFFWSDLNSPANVVNGTVTAAFKIGGLTVHSFEVSSTGNSSIGFGGVTTDGTPFDSVTFTLKNYSSGFFFPTADNFNIGLTPVPEPGGWVAAAFTGFVVLGGFCKEGWRFLRRRRAAKA